MPTKKSGKTSKKAPARKTVAKKVTRKTTSKKVSRASRAKKPNKFIKTLKANPIIVAVVVLVALVGLVFAFQSVGTTKSGIKLYLDPSTGSYQVGSNVTVEIREDSLSTPVNAVNAEVSYDADKFSVVGVDATGSPFEFKFIEDTTNGIIKIARGTTTPVSGKQLIAKVTLKPLAKTSKTALTFGSESAIADSANSQNVLKTVVDGSYSIK